MLEPLPLASRVGKTLVGGIDLNKARMRQERIVQEHRRQRCASDERKAARFRASVQSTGGVRVPAAHGVRDVPLPKTPEGAIMAHNPPGILGMSVLND